jgi:hypothetical protein
MAECDENFLSNAHFLSEFMQLANVNVTQVSYMLSNIGIARNLFNQNLYININLIIITDYILKFSIFACLIDI